MNTYRLEFGKNWIEVKTENGGGTVTSNLKNKCFPVEWDYQYTGGNYSSAGNITYVPFTLLDNKGDEDEQVGRALMEYEGVDPIHIIHYTFDEVYDAEGNAIEDDAYDAAVDGMESLLLSMACAGIDLNDPRIHKAVETALDAIVVADT